jgi:hypothetical protein
VAEVKFYKTRGCATPLVRRSTDFLSRASPLILSTTHHDCPITPSTSPSHYDPRCTLAEERLSRWLPCSCIGLQSTCDLGSHTIRAYLYHSGYGEAKLYLQRLRELYVSSTNYIFGATTERVDLVAPPVPWLNFSTSLASLAKESSRTFRMMSSVFGVHAHPPTHRTQDWRNGSSIIGTSHLSANTIS